MHNNYYNTYDTLPWKRLPVGLWKWVSEGVRLMSYYEVVEGRLSEIKKKKNCKKVWVSNICSELRTPEPCAFCAQLCIPPQLGAVFCIDSCFLQTKLCIANAKSTDAHIVL